MNKRKKGFTLAEIIISVAILSVVSVYLLQMFVSTKNLADKSFEIDQSVRISKNIIELLSSGEKISKDNTNKLLSNMNLENGNYILNFDDKFEITTREKSSYRLNLELNQKEGLNNINIKVIRLKPYILDSKTDIEISNINSVKMINWVFLNTKIYFK